MKERIIQALTVYHADNKTRIGRNADGGYVLVDGLDYDFLISGGVGSDTSFENEIMKQIPSGIVVDGTVKRVRNCPENLIFLQEMIGENSLTEYIDAHENILLKMDIEGAEVPWILSLDTEHIKKFRQIVIEFHNLKEKTLEAVEKLNETHVIVHAHGNNTRSVMNVFGNPVPRCYELTFVRRSEFPDLKKNTLPLPSELDYPCRKSAPDLDMNFEPFVHERDDS